MLCVAFGQVARLFDRPLNTLATTLGFPRDDACPPVVFFGVAFLSLSAKCRPLEGDVAARSGIRVFGSEPGRAEQMLAGDDQSPRGPSSGFSTKAFIN